MSLITIRDGGRLELLNGSLSVGPLPPVVSAYDTLILASSPIAYYKMDETSGTVMADSSGNANDGDYDLPVTLGSTGVTNDGGTSVAFTGSAGSFANMMPGVLDLASSVSPITIEGWFNTVANIGPLVTGRGPTGTPVIGIYMGADGLQSGAGQIFCIIRDNGGGGLSTLASPLAYNDGGNHHFVMTIPPTTKLWSLYVDGVSVDTGLHGLGEGITTSDPQLAEDAITLGGGPHAAFPGRIDNVAVYSTTLSAGTILAHYNAGI